MKNPKQKNHKKFFVNLGLSSLFLLVSCTKEIPYKSLPGEVKEQTVASHFLNQTDTFLYTASQLNSSRSAADARPFTAGDNKRVKLEVLKNSLRIVEVERDNRFTANKTNNKLVLEIPIEHVEYRCAKDSYGQCTNTEEEAKDVPWEQRSLVKIKFEEAKSGQIDMLPLINDQECYSEVSSRLVKADIEKDNINFQVERTFKSKFECFADDATEIADGTITALYHYSLAKLDTVLSKDFKTIEYNENSLDENSFGFFSSKTSVLDVDNNRTNKSNQQIMNHWNPLRHEIVYHLSDEFAKPENKQIKDLTFKTFENLNKGLATAGVRFRLKLNEPSGKIPGDIRNSMIVLVEDPVASNVIGYGPQTEDPVTGEIVSARTIMFLGTIKKFIKYTYDEIVREKQFQKRSLAKNKTEFKVAQSLTAETHAKLMSGQFFGAANVAQATQVTKNKAKEMDANSSAPASAASSDESAGSSSSTQQLSSIQINDSVSKLSSANLNQQIKNFEKQLLRTRNTDYSGKDFKSQMRYQNEVKNCAFAPIGDSSIQGISQKLMNQISDDAKTWEQLDTSEKEKIISMILPEIWVPTLIHEMGHNLGLRHNFAASEDKNNFYSNEQLSQMGIDHEVPFSSVMDYGNDLKTLSVLGKYDIAALKFGYLRKVDVVKDDMVQTVSIDDTLEKQFASDDKTSLVDYKFCTDDNLGSSATCKQFDLGTTYTEVAQNLIKDYEEGYARRNLRGDKPSFSKFDESSYNARISGIFKDLRYMMEARELYKKRFGLADNNPIWENEKYAFLKDIKQAAILSGEFLNSVLLVPEVTCAIANKDEPSTVMTTITLSRLNDMLKSDEKSCFDFEGLSNGKDKLIVIGQAGKPLNSIRYNTNREPDQTEIDVRGIWMDKIAALKMLTQRQVGHSNFDKFNENYLNFAESKMGLLKTIQGIMMNTIVNKTTFNMIDGSTLDLDIDVDFTKSQIIERPFRIAMLDSRGGDAAKYAAGLASKFGLRSIGDTPFQYALGQILVANLTNPNMNHAEDETLVNGLSIYKAESIQVNKFSKSAKLLNLHAVNYVADTQNIFGFTAIKNHNVAKALEAIEPAKLAELYELKANKQQLPPKATAEEKEAWKVSADNMKLFLMGAIQSSQYYENLLTLLPVKILQ